MTSNIYDVVYWTLRQENDAFLQRQKWWWRHYLAGTLKSIRLRKAQGLGLEGEKEAMKRIRALGFEAHQTTPRAPFDLWVQAPGLQAVRVEVKTSTWSECYRRYEFDVRQTEIDLVICLAKNGRFWPYVIPALDLRGRRNVALWSPCPGDYKGQWSKYLEAWQHLEEALANQQQRVWQLELPGGGQ